MVTELAVTEQYVLQQAASGDTTDLNANVTRAVSAWREDYWSTLYALSK